MKPTTISVLCLSATLSLGACSDRTEDNASETLRDAGETASSAADDAARNAERAGDAVRLTRAETLATRWDVLRRQPETRHKTPVRL